MMTGMLWRRDIIASISEPDGQRIPPVFKMQSDEMRTEWHLCMYEEIYMTEISLICYFSYTFCCFFPASCPPASCLAAEGGFFWFLTIIGIHPRLIIFSIIDLLLVKDSNTKTNFLSETKFLPKHVSKCKSILSSASRMSSLRSSSYSSTVFLIHEYSESLEGKRVGASVGGNSGDKDSKGSFSMTD